MKFGLSLATCVVIRRIFEEYPAIHQAVIYGSRATGNFKSGSDIDLTLIGADLNYSTLTAVAGDLYDSPIPYTVDLSLFEKIDNPALREHITRVGLVFYERGSPGDDQ